MHCSFDDQIRHSRAASLRCPTDNWKSPSVVAPPLPVFPIAPRSRRWPHLRIHSIPTNKHPQPVLTSRKMTADLDQSIFHHFACDARGKVGPNVLARLLTELSRKVSLR